VLPIPVDEGLGVGRGMIHGFVSSKVAASLVAIKRPPRMKGSTATRQPMKTIWIACPRTSGGTASPLSVPWPDPRTTPPAVAVMIAPNPAVPIT
jgi:hypothetical protein